MPELPDLTVYIDALSDRIMGRELVDVRLRTPFLLRTVEPPLNSGIGKKITDIRRVGKRVVLEFNGELFFVFHLMIAGRFRWNDKKGAKIPARLGHGAFDFESGTLILTEASKKKRASLHVLQGETSLSELDPGGVEPLEIDFETFCHVLEKENHTIKRTLTDPRLLSGIGNAYSDEVLHQAKLSPLIWTQKLTAEEKKRLFKSVQQVLSSWIDRLRKETSGGFPEKVTAFREEMAVHGKFGQPCPECSTEVQRIAYADNETNYCPRCQTGGKVLADRSLSRLLKKDWPKTIESLENLRRK